MSTTCEVKITPAVESVLRRSRIEGCTLYLPEQLDRKLYEETNKVLTLLGGKWKSGKVKGHVFESDPGMAIEEALEDGSITDSVKKFQFYPTPVFVVDLILHAANINPNSEELILEPSAGSGAIIARALEIAPRLMFHCFEIQRDLQQLLTVRFAKERVTLYGDDFLQAGPPPKQYNLILANPPFTRGQAIAHANAMLDCLAPGGQLACVMPASLDFATDRKTKEFRQRMETLGRSSTTKIPPGSFKESGTMVNTVLLVFTKRR